MPYVTYVWLNMTCVTGLGCVTTFDYMLRKWQRIDYKCEKFRHVVYPRWRRFAGKVAHVRYSWRNTTPDILLKILILAVLYFLCYYTEYDSSSRLAFRYYLSDSSSRMKPQKECREEVDASTCFRRSSWTAWNLKMGPMGFHETSVNS
jgi:hypothetical protein